MAYGGILLRLGYTDHANQVFEKAFQVYPSFPGLAYAYGKTLLAKGALQAALSPLIIAIGSKPIDPQPYIDYAQTLLAVHDSPEEAIQALQQAIQVIVTIEKQLTPIFGLEEDLSSNSISQIDPSQKQPILISDDHWEGTSLSGWTPERIQTTRLSAQALLAEAYEANGDLNSALKTFSEALESGLASSHEWHVRLSLGMARVALHLDQPEIAIAALQEVSRTNTQNPYIFRILAEAYATIHLPEEALQAAQAMIQIAPDDIETLSWFASLCTLINARAEAIPALNRAMQLDPDDAGLALHLGQLLLQLSESDTAHQAFLKVIANPNAISEHLSQAADSLITLGDIPAATLALEKACTLGSGADTQLLLRLANLYSQTFDFSKALDTIVTAIESDPSNASLYFYKAGLHEKLGRPQAAQASLERALNLQPSNPAFHLHLASLLRSEGDLIAAQLHADTAVAITQETTPLSITQIARGLAADLNRMLLQPDLALKSLNGKSQATPAFYPNEDDCLLFIGINSFDPVDEALYFCTKAELALDQDEEIAAAEALTHAIELAPNTLRVQALQSRLAFRRGDQPVALQSLQHALSELEHHHTHRNGLFCTPVNDVLALGIAALDLEQWDTALNLLERASAQATFEPLPALYLARALVLRAEYQRVCQTLDCQSHAPGVMALDQNSFQAFQHALQTAFTRLPDDLRAAPPNLYLRWEARGNAVFQPSSENLQTLEAIRFSPDDDAAWLGQIALGGDLVAVNQACSVIRDKYQGSITHPAILAQIAISKGFKGRRQEDLSESISAVQSAIDQRPYQPLFHVMLSRLASNNGNLALAQHAILTALSFWPDEPRWHAQAASLYLENGDIPSAISHLEKATTYEPYHMPHYLALGKAHLQTSQPAQAIAALEHAVEVAPDHAEGYLALASAYLSVGDLKKASASAQGAIDSAPDQLSPLILRADLAIQMDDPALARSCAEQALRLQPDNTEALHLYAQALHKLGQTKQALQVVEKAIPLAADPLPLLLEQTSILESLEGYSATLKALQELAGQYPNDPSVLAPLAKALAETNQDEEAIHTAQRALRGGSHALRPPEQANLHHLLGKLLYQTGQLDQAIHQFSEATQLSPNQLEYYLDLGKAQLERRQNMLAIQSFQKAIQVAPEDPRPFYQAGLVYKASRDYPEAEIMLRRAAELAPDDITIHRQLAALVALNLVHSRRPVPLDA
jgi:tetratricopeptide (TPR) repeat protein